MRLEPAVALTTAGLVCRDWSTLALFDGKSLKQIIHARQRHKYLRDAEPIKGSGLYGHANVQRFWSNLRQYAPSKISKAPAMKVPKTTTAAITLAATT